LTARAFILGSDKADSTADLARPLAGAPLLVRQLEWLAAAGIEEVAVNRVATTPLPSELSCDELCSVGLKVLWIPSGSPLGVRELADRVGSHERPVVVVPHGVLGAASLGAVYSDAEASSADLVVGESPLRVAITHLDGAEHARREQRIEGWLCLVDSEAAAHALAEEVLSATRQGIVVRGTQVSPGIWRARGAIAAETAVLRPPCYLGRGCFVSEGAEVGPGAVLGERSIVESQARVIHARIAPGVVVGQGVVVERACAFPGRLVRHAGRELPIEDPLLLGMRGKTPAWALRLAAAVALSIAGPFAALTATERVRVFRRLARVVEGSGRWVGVRDEQDPDGVVLDVLSLLVPPDAHDEELQAARALYSRTKSPGLDVRLVAGLLFGNHGQGSREGERHARWNPEKYRSSTGRG